MKKIQSKKLNNCYGKRVSPYNKGSFFFRVDNISFYEKGVIFMVREFIVKETKYGRDWKKIGEGIDFLDDNKKISTGVSCYWIDPGYPSEISI